MRYGQIVMGPAGSGKVIRGMVACMLLIEDFFNVVHLLQQRSKTLPDCEEDCSRDQPGPSSRTF